MTDDARSGADRPDSLLIGGQRYTVEWVTDGGAGLGRYSKPGEVGHTMIGRTRVLVRDDGSLSPDQQRDTLVHAMVDYLMEGTGHSTADVRADLIDDMDGAWLALRKAVAGVYVNHVGQEGRGAAVSTRDTVLAYIDEHHPRYAR